MRRSLAPWILLSAIGACTFVDNPDGDLTLGPGSDDTPCLDCLENDPQMQSAEGHGSGAGSGSGSTRPTYGLSEIPPTLADTGLCVDDACTQIAAGVREFKPRWPLWSDGAEKRRWILLPPGTQIDTSDPDVWKFPVGTKLWKQFTRDGVLVETRYMARYGAGDADWLFVPYEWAADGSKATPALSGASNVNGTPHDIPPQSRCPMCHQNVKSRVLGFQALQLDDAAASGLVDLDDAAAMGWLSRPPAGASPHYPVPGTAQDKAALGYFHANCGHCHNSNSPLVNHPMLRLEVGYLSSVQATRAYQSSVNVAGQSSYGGATIIAKPGDPDHSIIITRMSSTDPSKRMPWLGGETIDSAGVSTIRTWITNL